MATAHPLATDAAVEVLAEGGSAVDAAIAAQAVVGTVLPQAAGLGGDVLALVHDGRGVSAVNGAGRSPAALPGVPPSTGGGSVTVPGAVDGWLTLHRRWGRLPLGRLLRPAIRLAAEGADVDATLAAAVRAQRQRLRAGGADGWDLTRTGNGDRWRQPALAALLDAVARDGREAFYAGPAAAAVSAAAVAHGGWLTAADLDRHETTVTEPVSVRWLDGEVYVQPPMSQGVLLALALQATRRLAERDVTLTDHVLVEVTGGVFAHRSDCGAGAALLDRPVDVDTERSTRRGGPRSYLHTAGVAVADADGQVVSSLVSVFDDFGSGVYVPELGIVLNNRAAGFTDGANAPGPGKRPVHTLAPAMLVRGTDVLGLATPGADGQVQTLLQVLHATASGLALDDAVTAHRWRGEDGVLLVERGHPATADLSRRGHLVRERPPGADVFGAVVAAGTEGQVRYAVGDWRRRVSTGAVT